MFDSKRQGFPCSKTWQEQIRSGACPIGGRQERWVDWAPWNKGPYISLHPFHHLPSMEWRKKIGVPANVTDETVHLPSVNINVCHRTWQCFFLSWQAKHLEIGNCPWLSKITNWTQVEVPPHQIISWTIDAWERNTMMIYNQDNPIIKAHN